MENEKLNITVNVQVDFETYKTVHNHVLKRKSLFSVLAVYGILIALAAYLIFQKGGFDFNYFIENPIFLIFLISTPIYMVVYKQFVVNRGVKLRYNDSNNVLKHKSEYQFSKNGYTLNFTDGYIDYKWQNQYLLEETEAWFLFYINKMSVQIIPKEQLTTTQTNQLKHLFETVDVKRKKLLS